MKRVKTERVREEILAFLGEIETCDDVPLGIRRKARNLALRYEESARRGPGSNLKPGDRGALTAFVDQKIEQGKSLRQAAMLASKRFNVVARRIEQIYHEFCRLKI